MAVFVHDTFTNTDGTLLSDHTGETGASWTQLLVDRPVYISANRVLYTSGTNFYYRYKASGTPSNANYNVEADIYVLSNEDYCGVLGRAVDDDNHFYAYYNSTAWVLYKRVAAVNTLLGTYTVALTVGNTYRLKLEMVGSTIKVFVDGVERISATETDLSAAGNAGVWGRHDATTNDGYGIAEFWATDVAGAIQQAVAGEMPAASGTLAFTVSYHTPCSGICPAPTGALSKLTAKGVTGAMPAGAGALSRHTSKQVTGDTPAASGNLATSMVVSQALAGVMGLIEGVVSAVQRGRVKFFKLLGACFRKFIS